MRHAAAHQWNAEVGMVLRADHHGHGRVLRKSREQWRVVSCETVVRIWTGGVALLTVLVPNFVSGEEDERDGEEEEEEEAEEEGKDRLDDRMGRR